MLAQHTGTAGVFVVFLARFLAPTVSWARVLVGGELERVKVLGARAHEVLSWARGPERAELRPAS